LIREEKRLAILEKEVKVKWHPTNKDWYVKKGYFFTKFRDEFTIKTMDLIKGSSKILVTKVCDDCGYYSKNIPYNIVMRGRDRTDGKDRCHKCAAKYRGIIRKENVKFEKSIEYYANKNKLEYLLKEFSKNNNKLPCDISAHTNDEYLWICQTCESEYPMKVNDRTSGNQNCPYCVNRRVNHTNCLWTTHPEIADLLKNKNRGYEITYGVGQKEIFVCRRCGHEKSNTLNKISQQGFSCSKCSDGLSYPEKIMYNVLEQIGIQFTFQKNFKWSNGKKYDFYIPSLNCIIETHGIQHYEESRRGRSLKDEQKNDEIKKEFAMINEIERYIIIDCRISQLNFIRENILSSLLSKLVDLNQINWEECHEFSLNSMIKDACNLWSEGIKNTRIIGNKLKLSRNTIVRYLKQGAEIGWCNYDPKEALRDSAKIVGEKSRKRTVQLSMKGEFIRVWESATHAANGIGIAVNTVARVCRKGLNYSVGGFKWLFEDEYLKLKDDITSSDIRVAGLKKVVQLESDNSYVNEYNSLKEASLILGILSSGITSACKGRNKTAGGFKWMYKEDYQKYIEKQKLKNVL
jgi:hypothetical protein